MHLSRRLRDRSLVRFLVVGVSNTGLSFVVFSAAVALLPPDRAGTFIAQAISYGAGLVWSYMWNRAWAFQSSGSMRPEVTKFLRSQLLLLLLTASSVSALVHAVGMGPSVSWIIVMTLATVLNYLMLKSWVFSGG